jgi:hypothetical protein
VGWRRQFEASDRVQREDVGGAITLGPWANASLESGARFDLIYHWLGEVYAQAGFGDADLWRLTAGWRYERPTFGADSIWNAFSVMPWQDLTLRGHVNPGLWRLNADAGARRFDAGPADAQAPGAELVGVVLPEDPATAGLNPHPIAWDGGARVTRWLDESGDLHMGAEARLGFGYGGRRHYGDVFGQVPVLGAGHFAPMFLTAAQKQSVADLVHRHLINWARLSQRAISAGRVELNLTPKHHYLAHLPEVCSMINPSFARNYSQESFVGMWCRIYAATKSGVWGSGIQRATLGKYLLSLELDLQTMPSTNS